MVRGTLGTLAALVLAGSAQAAEVDWSRAGGALFAGLELAGPETPVARLAQAAVAPDPLHAMIDAAADTAGVDRRLMRALVAVESAFKPQAVSPAGAAGLTQLMPGTAMDLGVTDRFDPAQNLAGGATYLAAQIARFGDVRLALAAYNAGPARVNAARGVPAIPETRQYVDAVIACVLAQMAGRSVRSARDCATGSLGR